MGSGMGFFQLTYKLLPVKQKVLTGFKTMSAVYGRIFSQKVDFFEDESVYQLQIGSEKSLNEPVGYYGCDFVTGFVKEYMSWVGNGKVYEVNEKECRSNGHDHCIYQISKVPLD
jgi:predicted hydrocarbon binding protein